MDLYREITLLGIGIIVLVHIIGFYRLDAWMSFSGIENGAKKFETYFGRMSLYLLNLSAIVLFTGVFVIYYFEDTTPKMNMLAIFLMAIFVLRGLIGYLMTGFKKTGSATPFWEVVFSSASFIVGFTGLLGLR